MTWLYESATKRYVSSFESANPFGPLKVVLYPFSPLSSDPLYPGVQQSSSSADILYGGYPPASCSTLPVCQRGNVHARAATAASAQRRRRNVALFVDIAPNSKLNSVVRVGRPGRFAAASGELEGRLGWGVAKRSQHASEAEARGTGKVSPHGGLQGGRSLVSKL
ncbi:hypothetical protein PPROV_001056100 [Pycnococcus provasolii]|uniref:Uncharacterized protein n=1 Tax=Pycnococcus provasolii TaxID=41880 RepID=A0A830HXL3_9CHLO|nr:hypothetical protein PPROV_001056100 [Pycnococcus provasolii]